MKKFINKIKNNKVLSILSVLIIGLFFILVTRITYAYLAPVINDAQTNVVGSTDTVDDFKFELGNPLKINATPTTLKENGSNYTTSTTAKALLKANSTKKTATYNYYVYFQIKSNTFTYSDGSTPEIILTVTNPNGEEVTSIEGLTYGTFNGVSGFDITTKKDLFNIANSYEITSNSSTTYTTQSWTIKITYLNLSIDQSTNFGNSMGVNVYITKNEKKPTVSEYVISQYTGTQGENNIYYHDSTLPNGAGDNSYRYAGASDQVNNFVCFGSTAKPCPTDNLYRIIGVFENKVKLIKYDYATNALLGIDGDYKGSSTPNLEYYKGNLTSIDTYYWNNVTKKSTWSESNLNKINLNTNYLNNIGTTWSNMIEDTTWKVSGNSKADLTPSVMYNAEITNATKTYGPNNGTSKIGLMYASDYGFAASPSAWTTKLESYSNSLITSVNWIYIGYADWIMTPKLSDSVHVFFFTSLGSITFSVADTGFGTRPVMYLKSSVLYAGGSGTKDSPITLVV